MISGFHYSTPDCIHMITFKGSESSAVKDELSFGIQCLSGTGALRVGAEFLQQQLKCSVVLVSDPTWGNHNLIFKLAGFTEIKKYRYWGKENRNLDFSGMIEDLKAAPERAVVILHGCAHNPTGIHSYASGLNSMWREHLTCFPIYNKIIMYILIIRY